MTDRTVALEDYAASAALVYDISSRSPCSHNIVNKSNLEHPKKKHFTSKVWFSFCILPLVPIRSGNMEISRPEISRPGISRPEIYFRPRYFQPGYSRPRYFRPGYFRPGYFWPGYSRPRYFRPGYFRPRPRPEISRPEISRPELSRPGISGANCQLAAEWGASMVVSIGCWDPISAPCGVCITRPCHVPSFAVSINCSIRRLTLNVAEHDCRERFD